MAALTFEEILKKNPYHDPKTGRFTTGPGGSSTPKTKITTEMTDYYDGESFMVATAYRNNEVAGQLKYSEYNGIPNVQFIETAEAYKRQGIATELMQDLQRRYPDTEINFGMTTPDGTKFLESITYEVKNEKIAAEKKRLNDMKSELEENQKKLDKLYELLDTGDLTEAQDKELTKLGDRWQELYEGIHRLEPELEGQRETSRFVRLNKSNRLFKTFDEIIKAGGNPYHDPKTGRFTFRPGGSAVPTGGMSARDYKKKLEKLNLEKNKLMKKAIVAFDADDKAETQRCKEAYDSLNKEIEQMKQQFMKDGGEEKLRAYAQEIVREQENNIRNLPKEKAIIVNQQGDVVWSKDGDENSVGFSADEMFGKKGMILTHNHPDDEMGIPMLSTTDIVSFAMLEFGEMRAVSQLGPTYSIKRTNNAFSNKAEVYRFAEEYKKAWANAQNYFQQKLIDDGSIDEWNAGKITTEALKRRGSNYMNEYLIDFCSKNAGKFGLEFAVENAGVKQNE